MVDPITMSAASSAANLGSTFLQGMFSARQAKSQMRFQRDMYKQRYQFQVEDLKKAGLNPMLAYQQAAPAAPAGAMGQMDAPDLVSSARAGMLMKAEKERIDQDAATAKAVEEREKEQKKLLYNTSMKLIAEHKLLQNELQGFGALRDMLGEGYSSANSAQIINSGVGAAANLLGQATGGKGIPFISKRWRR